MSEDLIQETLNDLLQNLKSGDAARQGDAIRQLSALNFTSEAIVLQLEKLALGENAEIRAAALKALRLKTSRFVMSKRSNMTKSDRQRFLSEIAKWETDGLVEPHRAEILRRRYDFDLRPEEPAPIETTAAEPSPSAPPAAQHAPHPAQSAARAIPVEHPASPSLAQILLSETSVKIYLYLGAFFVIAASAILAALVEAARLPVLLVATLAFAAGAMGLRKRLPQPSFALAVVFSFLLPIDANVIADLLLLSPTANEIYWSLVFLLMALIWAAGTWFYASRLFSAAGFLSLLLAVLRFSEIFDARAGWSVLSVAAASLLALLGMLALKTWRDGKFILPVFLLAQLVQPILLIASVLSTLSGMIADSDKSGDWLAAALTWLLAASFYAASDLLIPFVFFPWMATASLFPIPWLVLSAFNVSSSSALLAGFALWGALATFASQFVRQARRAALLTKYHFPLLALSLALFLTSTFIGYNESAQWGLAALLGAGMVYALAHILRPRWYVWMAALLAGLGAYLTLFALPFMANIDVYMGYQLLGASLFLLIPELFFKQPLSFARIWNWPPVALGTLLTFFNLLIALFVPIMAENQFGNTAILLGVYAILFTCYALRFQRPFIGYFTAASAAWATLYTFQHFRSEAWLVALTALAFAYYLAGYFLSRGDLLKEWGKMLIYSGLGLGALTALLAPFESGGLEKSIPIALAATLFAVEAFTRKNVWLGFPANALYLLSYFVILNELKVNEPQFFTVGAAALGLFQHYLLNRAGSRRAAFITGLVSQLILLGASYVQMAATGELKYFFLLFLQSLAVLGYGMVVRSRSLVIAPLAFVALAVLTILYNALKNLSLVFLIGITGILLLTLGILAAVLRQRIASLAERFSDWEA